MNRATARLASRLLRWQLSFSLMTCVLVSLLVPRLLLLRDHVARDVGVALAATLALAFIAAFASGALALWRQRFVRRALALGSRSVEPFEIVELSQLPWHLARAWVGYASVGLGAGLFARPDALDLASGVTVALLALVLVVATTLPLYAVLRALVLEAVELAPPEAAREALENEVRAGSASGRVARRLLTAVATPVAFLAIGAALITSAHLRRADERQREETARALAGAALGPVPGVLPYAGSSEARQAAANLGFSTRLDQGSAPYALDSAADGMAVLTVPLDQGSASVRFARSTVAPLTVESLGLVLLVVLVAALVGVSVGRGLSADLRGATLSLRLLGTETVLAGGTRIDRPARFARVAELGRAVDQLADRFRVFAQAQERAIEARETAARLRGVFFASVSHDLKSPLNAILGFTDLVRQTEPLTPAQAESLELVSRRGRELLALIETILDAARVEAAQLALLKERVTPADLVELAAEKGRDLGGDSQLEIATEVDPGAAVLHVDRARLGRVLATFVGHALRISRRGPVRVHARAQGDGVCFSVDVPTTRTTARELEGLLASSRVPGAATHRGLGLGLGLARAIVEQHGGRVSARNRSDGPALDLWLPLSG